MAKLTENDVLLFYWPAIKRFCYERWGGFEMEDRVQEAAYFFVCALRSLSLTGGHFWEEYCQGLILYMKKCNASAQSRYFRECSLYRPINNSNDDMSIALVDVLHDSGIDESASVVQAFLNTLEPEDARIVRSLQEKIPKSCIARKYGLSAYSLNERIERIGMAYIKWQETD